MFNSVINAYDLRELYMSEGSFTWSNNQADPTLEKLDRILVTSDCEKPSGQFISLIVMSH
jgi:hypothetical protein